MIYYFLLRLDFVKLFGSFADTVPVTLPNKKPAANNGGTVFLIILFKIIPPLPESLNIPKIFRLILQLG